MFWVTIVKLGSIYRDYDEVVVFYFLEALVWSFWWG
jgi:hypothetical protein